MVWGRGGQVVWGEVGVVGGGRCPCHALMQSPPVPNCSSQSDCWRTPAAPPTHLQLTVWLLLSCSAACTRSAWAWVEESFELRAAERQQQVWEAEGGAGGQRQAQGWGRDEVQGWGWDEVQRWAPLAPLLTAPHPPFCPSSPLRLSHTVPPCTKERPAQAT